MRRLRLSLMYRSAPRCPAWRVRAPRSRPNGCRKWKENRVQCAESLRVQAYFDQEVDAVSAAEIERHAEHCSECRALLEDLEKVRATLRRHVTYAAAPPVLRAQILRALDQE